tara:strand:+ start:390 stop:608 length:219 start_codon:yes stop_codon:yes gene_type:complete
VEAELYLLGIIVEELMDQILFLQEQQQLLLQVVVMVEEFIPFQIKMEVQVVLAEAVDLMAQAQMAEQVIHLQ